MDRLETEDDLTRGLDALAAQVPEFAEIRAAVPRPPLRKRPRGFETLFLLIVEQQISVVAAQAIWARLEAAGVTRLDGLARADDDALGRLGLTRPKQRAVRALEEAVRAGALSFERQRDLPLDAAIAELTAIRGIGRWTAEVYHMTAEMRADVLPIGDIALQEAARALYGLETRPKPAALAALGAPWAPWRAVAARLLWSYYAVLKGRDGKA